MRKFLSSILAVVMVLSSMAMVVSAEDTVQTTGIWVGTTAYSSLDSAAAAASQTESKEITIVGRVEVDSRQTIAYEGIVIQGHDGATIAASGNFKNSSETNRKAVLTIAANNVKVNNLTVDGTGYDETLASASTFDFNVVRVNSGTGVELNNVTIKGSKRTLLSVGQNNDAVSSVYVKATNLVCEAEYKSLPGSLLGTRYADVNVKDGTFELVSGTVDGFICKDRQCEGVLTIGATASNHYTLTQKLLLSYTQDITSTVKHFVYSYAKSKENATTYTSEFADAMAYASNLTAVANMVNEAKNSTDKYLVENFIDLLTVAKDDASDATVVTALEGHIATLNTTLAGLNSAN